MKELGYVGAGDVMPSMIVVISTQGCGGAGIVLAKGSSASSKGKDGTGKMMATAAMSNGFVAVSVFLVVEGDGRVGGEMKFGGIVMSEGKAALADEEGDGTEIERRVVVGFAVFAWTEQEEDGNPG